MNKKNILDFITLLPVYWIFTGMFFVENGDKKLVAFTLISLCISLIRFRGKIVSNFVKSPLVVVLSISAIYLTVSRYFIGGSSQEVRAYLAMLVLVIITPPKLITTKKIDVLLLVSSLFMTGFVAFNYFVLGVSRGIPHVGGGFNPIPYASAVSAFGTLACYRLFASKKLWLLIPLVLMSLIVVVTQTRGVILPYFAILIFLALGMAIKEKMNWKVLFVILAVLGGSIYASSIILHERIEATWKELEMIKSGKLVSSMGLRLQFWDVAWKLIEEKPILGYGNEHEKRLQELYRAGETSKRVAVYSPTHFHNQYLDKWAKKGIIGLTLLILLQLLPLYLVFSNQTTVLTKIYAVSLVGLFVGISIGATPFRQALAFIPILFTIYLLSLETKSGQGDE